MIKKHIKIVKSMYPELYIEVDMVINDILVGINSLDIYDEEKFEDLMDKFSDEYESKGYFNIYWGVNSSLTCDNLTLLEDLVEAPVTENPQVKKVVNF